MNKGHQAMMFLIFLLFGILINLQFRGIIHSQPQGAFSAKEMAARLQNEKAENARLMERLTGLEAQREQLLNGIGAGLNSREINDLLKKRNFEYLRAGLIPVKGRGIVITMEDAPAVGELDYEDYIIHDRDVNDILDELKANGAEAISINGERVITTTKPVCAGPTIIVNESRYPPPYVIKAVGNPEILYEAIQSMPQVAFMRLADIRVDIAVENEIIIDRFHPFRSLEKILNGLEVVSQ